MVLINYRDKKAISSPFSKIPALNNAKYQKEEPKMPITFFIVNKFNLNTMHNNYFEYFINNSNNYLISQLFNANNQCFNKSIETSLITTTENNSNISFTHNKNTKDSLTDYLFYNKKRNNNDMLKNSLNNFNNILSPKSKKQLKRFLKFT